MSVMSVMAARVMRRRVGDELFVVARVRGLTILRVRSKDRTSSAASRSVAPAGVTMPNSGRLWSSVSRALPSFPRIIYAPDVHRFSSAPHGVLICRDRSQI